MDEVVPSDEDEASFETEPGLSSFASDPDNAGPSLKPLLDAAKKYVPADSWSSTRLWVKATAGVRSVESGELQPLVKSVDAYLAKSENCPFKSEGFDILAGEEEAIFAWTTVNSLTKSLEEPAKRVGILELGGSSMQIAFTPIGDVFSNKFSFYVGSQRTSLYAHSYPQFGMNDMVDRAKMASIPEGHDAAEPVDFPCFNSGWSEPWEVEGTTYTFKGTGDFTKCSAIVDDLLGVDMECLLPPCAMRGVHTAPVPVDKRFYGISAFFFVANGLGLVGWKEAKVVTPKAIVDAAETLCGKTYEEAKADGSSDWKFLKQYCLGGIYAHRAFKSFGFADDSESITFARKIDGQSAGWTLGAAMYEAEMMPKVREPCNEEANIGYSGWTVLLWAAVGMLASCLGSCIFARWSQDFKAGEVSKVQLVTPGENSV